MASIQSQLKLNDGMTAVLKKVTAALDMCLSSFEQVQAASGQAMNVEGINAARVGLSEANNVIEEMERNIQQVRNQQDGVNQSFKTGESAAGGLLNKITQMAAAYMSINAAKGFLRQNMDLSDGVHQTERQLRVVGANVGLTEDAYKRLINTASQLSNTTMYSSDAMVGAAAELATYINDADALTVSMQTVADYAAGMSGGSELNTQQMVEYATQLGKVFMGAYDGISKKGFELSDAQKKIIENGTDIQKALVVQEIINESWDGLAASMAALPVGQITQVKNEWDAFRADLGDFTYPAILGFFRTIQANMPQIQAMFYGLTSALAVIIEWLGYLLEGAVSVYSFFADNWGMIAPILFTIAAAFIILHGAQLAYNIVQGISNGLAALSTARSAIKSGATLAEAAATTTATGAQVGFNAALLACPIVWILLIIIAIIAAIYGIVAAINKVTGSTISATGIIFGVFTTLGAFLWNLFLGLLDLVLGVINAMINPFIKIANFIGNVFTSPISSIIYLFQGMADGVLAILQKIASAMDFIFGSHMADTVAGWRAGLKDMADSAVAKYAPNENYQKVMDELDLSAESLGLKRWAYSDAFNTGYSAGENVEKSIGDFFSYSPGDLNDLYGDGPVLDGMGKDLSDIADNTSGLKKISEDLVYLRDVAEREAINRFTTAEIKVDMTGMTNRIDSGMDIDGVIARFADGVREALVTSAEGVHA